MDSTASPSMSAALGRAAKFIRLLEEAGMPPEDFQLIIDSPRVRTQWVAALPDLRPPAIEFEPMPAELNHVGLQLLLDRIRADERGRSVAPALVRQLLTGLNDRDRTVVILRFGLADGKTQTQPAIGRRLNISATRVRHYEQRSVSRLTTTLWRHVTFQKGGDAEPSERSVLELGLSEGPGSCLARVGILTIPDLVSKTADDLMAITNFGERDLDEVVAKLADRGLRLRGA